MNVERSAVESARLRGDDAPLRGVRKLRWNVRAEA